MKFGGAKQFVLSGYEGEKIRVRLVSNTLSTLQNDFKVKIDDIRKRIDVDVIRKTVYLRQRQKKLSVFSFKFLCPMWEKLRVLSMRKP